MSKHTLGPWRLHDMEENTVVDATGNAVADCNGRSNPNHRNRANARLVAAAPEILAALEGLLAVAERRVDDNTPYSGWEAATYSGALSIARAAINRAKEAK